MITLERKLLFNLITDIICMALSRILICEMLVLDYECQRNADVMTIMVMQLFLSVVASLWIPQLTSVHFELWYEVLGHKQVTLIQNKIHFPEEVSWPC